MTSRIDTDTARKMLMSFTYDTVPHCTLAHTPMVTSNNVPGTLAVMHPQPSTSTTCRGIIPSKTQRTITTAI